MKKISDLVEFHEILNDALHQLEMEQDFLITFTKPFYLVKIQFIKKIFRKSKLFMKIGLAQSSLFFQVLIKLRKIQNQD